MIEAATAQLAVHVTVFRGGAASGHRAPAAATPQLQGLGALTEPAASMYEGAVVHLRDAKGLRHLARLLTHPDRPVLRLHPRPRAPLVWER